MVNADYSQSLNLQTLLKYFDWQDLEGLEEIMFIILIFIIM
jgi:hypothetical protein